MKIGIFGGSFNPPHKMHVHIAKELINKHYVDKVIFVPTGSKYKYKNNLLPDKYRFDMLQLIVNKDVNLSVSDFELKDNVVYTYQTLNYFKNKNECAEIYFICGADNLSYIDKWMNGEDILRNYKILVVERNGEKIENLLAKYKDYERNIIVANIKQKDISSTKIREKLKQNKSVINLLDDDVYTYIIENNLYK